jgi:FkbM family methyltransferase
MIENFISYIPNKLDNYIIFDIGSRDCLQSIEFYHKFPNSKIYAFECNPNTINLCKKNIEEFKDRITLIEGAVCDYDGEINFYPIDSKKTITSWEDGNPGASSLFISNDKYTLEKYSQYKIITKCHRLDTIIKLFNIKNVDIVWMDLQGAELLALKGLGDHLRNIKYIHTEINHHPIYDGQVLFNEIDNYLINYFSFNRLTEINNSFVFEDAIYENKFYKDPIFDGIDLSYDQQTYERGKPREYFLYTINLFNKYTDHKIILEIGSIRNRMNHDIESINAVCCNDGHSTYFWRKYTRADIYTVDIDKNCKNIIDSDDRLKDVNATTDDAISYAKSFDKKIDLLFLDAWDVFYSSEYAEKHLEIYTILKDKLSDNCLILIDDTDIGNGGKGKLIIPQLIKDGFQCLVNRRQSLFIRLTNNRNDTKFDIVIPVGRNDIDIIENQIEYTKKNIIGFRNIYLISYDISLKIKDCITISENIFPFSLETVAKYHGKRDRNNWYLQQLFKLYAGEFIPNILEDYLIIDADTFFLKPTSFFEDGKTLFNYGLEYHIPYFTHMSKLHPKLFKIDILKSGICHHMMFKTKYLKDLFEMVEKYHSNNGLFYDIFLKYVVDYNHSGASEYEIYFNFIQYKYPNDFKIRALNWKNSSSLDLNSDCDYISYHSYLR